MKQLESGLHRRRIEVSKSSPCVHCGKDDWCYVLHDGNISACKRNAEPTAGWYKTRKVDREGTPLYGTIASREAYKEQQVAEVVTAAGGCFVAIHHENKSKEAAGVEKASGSTSIISNVDAHWRITKASTGNKLLMPKTRGYSPVEMDYRIDFTNGICHAIEASEGTQHATRNSPTIGERVVAYLKEYESADGATVKEMAEALEVKEHPLREILRRLVNDGVIESVSSEGSKLKVYRLIDENEE